MENTNTPRSFNKFQLTGGGVLVSPRDPSHQATPPHLHLHLYVTFGYLAFCVCVNIWLVLLVCVCIQARTQGVLRGSNTPLDPKKPEKGLVKEVVDVRGHIRTLYMENLGENLREEKRVAPPPHDFFMAGAASRPATNCKTPPLETSCVRHCLCLKYSSVSSVDEFTYQHPLTKFVIQLSVLVHAVNAIYHRSHVVLYI